ncbi:unnamed protein product [Vicia faba]|uniref:Homeobox domain-containing protein n=1 Tax=Vicia faba TaxID=3906 RepID=A0AAV1B1X2_VICFA|nr:unnamed protein product [Vicia faba]
MESESEQNNEINEEGLNENGNNTNNSISSSSRWNPTKEQITLLENLYKQGIKTPSADEIQQITARLRAYGHIEGKNVFYWFQNHKARQRQKQKQENITYFNRFLHRPQPIFPSPIYPNTICRPYCIPQQHSHEFSYYTQNPKVLLPAVGYRRNQGEKVMSNTSMSNSNVYNNPMVYENNMQKRISEYETLDLFPLHPTGILEGKKTEQVSSIVSVSADSSTDANSGSPHHVINQPFFDFFNNSVGQGS